MAFKKCYILAQEAEERIVSLFRKEKNDAAEIFNTAIDACQTIILDMYDNAPDVVEVVRCKDCKFYEFWERKGIYLCERWAGDPYEAAQPGDDDFCSFAERREVKNGTD